jgi:hypothetical protein
VPCFGSGQPLRFVTVVRPNSPTDHDVVGPGVTSVRMVVAAKRVVDSVVLDVPAQERFSAPAGRSEVGRCPSCVPAVKAAVSLLLLLA